jgi:uncharacterized protein GlcG (DUF336 family)
MLTERTLADEDARRTLDAMASKYASEGLEAVLAATGDHGELIGFLRLAGAPLVSAPISAKQACTSARERRP